MSTWKTNKKTILLNCGNCGCEFKKTLSEYKRSEKLGRKHYCSFKCSSNFRKKILIKCFNCNNESNNPKFCSKSCAAQYNNKKRFYSDETRKKLSELGIKRYSKKGYNEYQKTPKYCKHCDKLIPYKKRKLVFCNRECKRQYDKRNMSEYQKYYSQCKFNFALNSYPNEFNFKLVEQHGWYSPTNKKNNLNGVSRDHIYSIREGYDNNISPEIIKHPANCQLLKQSKNSSKYINSHITIDDLNKKINEWNLKYST